MTCKDCGIEKPMTEFYKHPQMKGGVLNSCKECKKAYQRSQHHKNMEDPFWVVAERKRAVAKACSPAGMERLRRYRQEYPERDRAHQRVCDALRSGRMIKPDCCERCGTPGWLHGHHEDYSKPLEVEWLCVKCHRQEKTN